MRKELVGTCRLLVFCAVCLHTLAPALAQKPDTPDTSPHKSGFVTANGIKLHYLDWGGAGDVVLMLTGMGDDAHIFDDFAPKFTDRFHVVGLTRRGFGESDKPATGYDVRTRVEDIRAFLDAMKIKKVSLIGHSIAGDEITSFATIYPNRVRKLVYLDAAYDDTVRARFGPDAPDAPPRFKRLTLEALGSPDAEKIVVKDMPSADRWKRIVEIVRSHITVPPNYSKVTVPALAFYATKEHEVPPTADEATRPAVSPAV